MDENQHWSYDLLKSLITEKSFVKDEVEELKSLFKDEIQSPRRYACIETVADLLDTLERCDTLSEYNIEPLKQAAENLADEEIEMALDKYVRPPKPVEHHNVYALQRLRERDIKDDLKGEKHNIDPKPVIILEYTQKKRDDIHQLIAKEIGRDWRSLGRELLVRAGELDQIDIKYPHDLHSKVYEVLRIFENDARHNPREHFNTICEALDKCKRKDVRRYVQKIMTY